jgi:CheY-like chemotaxis protein
MLAASSQNFLHFAPTCPNLGGVTQPLVILLYERILPGSQLLNRFQDLGYRVQAISNPRLLVETAGQEKPLLAVVDMPFANGGAAAAIAELRADAATSHLPVIAIVPANDKAWEEKAVQARATLVAHDNAIVPHLDRFLQQALQIE